ncbi:hypothetical protein ACFX2C_022391 [Malus domestica]
MYTDRDREANTKCTWFTQIGYVHGVEEFSLIMKGLHKYIGLSSHFVSTSRCDIFSRSNFPLSRGGIFNRWRCTRLILELGWRVFWFHPEYKADSRI